MADIVELISETCERCEQPFLRRPGRVKHLCNECRKALWEENHEQQVNKSGPNYEKTVRKQLLYWRSEATRLKIRA